MRSDKDYEPKIIISPEDYDDYLLMFHRELLRIGENLDPPSPFRSELRDGENVKVVINDTNDLHYCIEHFCDEISNGKLTHVIVGDPATLGYKFETLDKMCLDFDLPVRYFKNKEWIIVLINITVDEKITVENSTINVRKKK